MNDLLLYHIICNTLLYACHTCVKRGLITNLSKMAEVGCVDTIRENMVVSWTDINYYVEQSTTDKLISRLTGNRQVSTKRKLLDSVSGSLDAGQVTGIMGKY